MEKEDPLGIGFCISKRYLFIIAGIIWCFAGYNVLHVGLTAYNGGWRISHILIAGAVFVMFFIMFIRIVQNNSRRVMAFRAEKVGIFNALSGASYIMMVIMMTLGISVRYSGLVPMRWIQTFYTGLGAALIIAGLFLFVEYVKAAVGAKRDDHQQDHEGEPLESPKEEPTHKET